MKTLTLGSTAPLLYLLITITMSVPLVAAASERMLNSDAREKPKSANRKGNMQGGKAPKYARDPNEHSGGYEYRGMSGWEETDEITFNKVIADQFEFQNFDGSDTLRWDMQGWRGTDYKKMWFKFEGEDDTSSDAGEFELQTLYSRSTSAFWDVQFGLRYDRAYENNDSKNRFFAVAGFQGLAPYWFEIEPAVFIDSEGNISARMVATYDLRFNQKLIFQPRFEFNLSLDSLPEYGVGKGLNDLQLGFRLRYEFRREFAPYIGIEWQRKYAETADFLTLGGQDIESTKFVAGVRFWF